MHTSVLVPWVRPEITICSAIQIYVLCDNWTRNTRRKPVDKPLRQLCRQIIKQIYKNTSRLLLTIQGKLILLLPVWTQNVPGIYKVIRYHWSPTRMLDTLSNKKRIIKIRLLCKNLRNHTYKKYIEASTRMKLLLLFVDQTRPPNCIRTWTNWWYQETIKY